jgi:hypothetical protein
MEHVESEIRTAKLEWERRLPGCSAVIILPFSTAYMGIQTHCSVNVNILGRLHKTMEEHQKSTRRFSAMSIEMMRFTSIPWTAARIGTSFDTPGLEKFTFALCRPSGSTFADM